MLNMTEFIIRLCTILNISFFNFGGTRQMVKQSFRNELCRRQMGFDVTGPLLKLCQEHTNLFHHASEGFHIGLDECRLSFEKRRWNCTTHSHKSDYKLFGTVMARGKVNIISFIFYNTFFKFIVYRFRLIT